MGKFVFTTKSLPIQWPVRDTDAGIYYYEFTLRERGIKVIPKDIIPMTIGHLGNNAVATIPTLLDLLLKGNVPGHQIYIGDKIMGSVGAGMNIYAMVYQF